MASLSSESFNIEYCSDSGKVSDFSLLGVAYRIDGINQHCATDERIDDMLMQVCIIEGLNVSDENKGFHSFVYRLAKQKLIVLFKYSDDRTNLVALEAT